MREKIMPVCDACGRYFKKRAGLSVHYGQIHGTHHQRLDETGLSRLENLEA